MPTMSAPESPARSDPWWRRPRWRGWDLPVAYALVVLVASVWIAWQPGGGALVLAASTNLQNMQQRPVQVLLLSLFVVSPLWFLLLLVPLVVAYREVQRWLGRIALVITVLLCHVFGSLWVMVAEVMALSDRSVSAAIVNRHDVGVSYGLAGVLGLLLVRVPRRLRLWYGLASVAAVIVLIVTRSAFSSIGHGSAWLIGVGLSWLVYVSARRAGPDASASARTSGSDR